jgi:hypothetical protein
VLIGASWTASPCPVPGSLGKARVLERRLERVIDRFEDAILSFDQETAEILGRLRVPNRENPLDKTNRRYCHH